VKTPLIVARFANNVAGSKMTSGLLLNEWPQLLLREVLPGWRSERRFAEGTFPTRSVVFGGRIDESLHHRILEIRVH
jgi:hypothetical protein